MTEQILIMGGSRFHGFQLACSLSTAGKKVYVLNRGRYRSHYDLPIQHLCANRNDIKSLKNVLSGLTFDTVIDNNGYNADQVEKILTILGSRCKHYIFTSTAAVYLSLSSEIKLKEQYANGLHIGSFAPNVLRYAIDKFKAEESVRKKCHKINYTIVRIPNIYGTDDFSGKLNYFYHRFQDGRKIFLEKEINQFSLICVQDVVRMFKRIISNKKCYHTTINFADPYPYTYKQFFTAIFQKFYQEDKIILLPAKKMWDAGYFLPFVWGPMIDTRLFNSLIKNFIYTPLEVWGKKAIKWELEQHKNKSPDINFLQKRNYEQTLIKRMI